MRKKASFYLLTILLALLIMHGAEDAMMPVSMAETLLKKATTRHKKLLIIQQADHNRVFTDGEQILLSNLNAML